MVFSDPNQLPPQPEESGNALAQFHHGASLRGPSEIEIAAGRTFLTRAIAVMAELADNPLFTGAISAATDSIVTRANSWIVTGVQEEKTKEMSVPETLYPAVWSRLKRVEVLTKSKLQQYGDMPAGSDFARALLRYAGGDSTLDVHSFMTGYADWITKRLRYAVQEGRRFEQEAPTGYIERAHTTFVGIFGVAKSLHALCQMCPELGKQMGFLREACAEVLELYRFQDDILTGGVEAALWDAVHQRSKLLADTKTTARPFHAALYDDPTSPVVQLEKQWNEAARALPKPKILYANGRKLIEVMLQTKPAIPSTKHDLLRAHLQRRFRGLKEDRPQVMIVCKTEILAGLAQRAVWDYLMSSERKEEEKFRCALLLKSISQRKKDDLFGQFAKGEINALVTTERPKAPLECSIKHMCILSLVQHAVGLKEYAWVKVFGQGEMEVEHVDLIRLQVRGSSDHFRRRRARRHQSGPRVVSPDIPVSAQTFLRWSLDSFKGLQRGRGSLTSEELTTRVAALEDEAPARVRELLTHGKEAQSARVGFELLSEKVLLGGFEILAKHAGDAEVENATIKKIMALAAFTTLTRKAGQFFNEPFLRSLNKVLEEPRYAESLKKSPALLRTLRSLVSEGVVWLRKEHKAALANSLEKKVDALI